MPDLLVDTDIFIDHLRGARRFDAGNRAVAYSAITRCELFAGRGGDEKTISLLLAPFAEIDVDREIAERAGRLRRDTVVRIADALVAATALEHGLTLITRNLRDYGGIPGLRCRAPD